MTSQSHPIPPSVAHLRARLTTNPALPQAYIYHQLRSSQSCPAPRHGVGDVFPPSNGKLAHGG
ncbi:hypothetical protein HaLaN_10960 [Haematococcus lacustris]|uniref:Uncharacterized protein n=1 Tax=Haematococcus lacustris TaxID=44745 RepID=A0A699YX31_HAELA|nr:hypothetical protein HaLaN_10960 [Haematococcus lacustris]